MKERQKEKKKFLSHNHVVLIMYSKKAVESFGNLTQEKGNLRKIIIQVKGFFVQMLNVY